MKSTNLFKSILEQKEVLIYLENWLDVSFLVREFGIPRLSSDCHQVDLTSTVPPPLPPNCDYDVDLGGEIAPCFNWLVHEIIHYLKSTLNGIVLMEDFCSRPSDEYYNNNAPLLPFLHFDERVFWPIIDFSSEADSVEKARMCCGSFREIFIFTKLPMNYPLPLESSALDKNTFQSMASTTTRIVTDVFQNAGYLDWKRKGE